MRFLFSLITFIYISSVTVQASAPNYIFPIDIEVILSSNFGELRKNHFHAGLDFKTFGKTGYALRSIESGYISRIQISSSGYGRVIYINHPTGHTSVYAHLEKFSPRIEQFIRQKQKALRQNEPDLYLMPGFLEVEKAEIIGFSGNSGRSDGPHLHFEIRNTQTEHPLNVLQFYPQIEDKIAPSARQLVIYEFDEENSTKSPQHKQIIPLYSNGNEYSPKSSYISVSKYFSVAVDAFDRMSKSPNTFGIYKLKLYVDKELYSEIAFDSTSFLDGRGINALLDYEMFLQRNRKVYSFYQSPVNELFVYKIQKNRGIINLSDEKPHLIEVFLEDYAGNQSQLSFKVKAVAKYFADENIFSHQQAIKFHSSEMMAEIPANALFFDENLDFRSFPNVYSKWSEAYKIGDGTIPLKEAMLIRFSTKNIPLAIKNKAFIQMIQHNGKKSSLFGIPHAETIEAQSADFGIFYLDVDNEAPTLSFLAKNEHINSVVYKVKAKDNKTFINSYAVYLDNEWQIAYFDRKSGIISVMLEKEDLKHAKNLKFEVFDRLNNKASESVKIY